MNEYENIKTVEQAFAFMGRSETLDLSAVPVSLRASIMAFYRLNTVIQALNDKWIPDKDTNITMDEKYILVVEMYHGRMKYHGFHVAKSIGDLSHARVFAFRSQAIVEYFAKHFLHLYRDFMLTTTISNG